MFHFMYVCVCVSVYTHIFCGGGARERRRRGRGREVHHLDCFLNIVNVVCGEFWILLYSFEEIDNCFSQAIDLVGLTPLCILRIAKI